MRPADMEREREDERGLEIERMEDAEIDRQRDEAQEADMATVTIPADQRLAIFKAGEEHARKCAALASAAEARAVPAGWRKEVTQRMLALMALKSRTDSMPIMNEWQWLNSLRNRFAAPSPAEQPWQTLPQLAPPGEPT